MKFHPRATLAIALALTGVLGAVSASAATGPTVKIIQGESYGFNVVTAIASNGANVWVANSSGNSVTELDASTGAKVRLLHSSKFGFVGPAQLSDDGTHV